MDALIEVEDKSIIFVSDRAVGIVVTGGMANIVAKQIVETMGDYFDNIIIEDLSFPFLSGKDLMIELLESEYFDSIDYIDYLLKQELNIPPIVEYSYLNLLKESYISGNKLLKKSKQINKILYH